jgi:hypothetical protein
MRTIRIVYSPSIQPLEGAAPPYIEMKDPVKPSETLIPELIFGDEEKPEEAGRYFFDVPLHAGQRILAMDSEIYLLWEPAFMKCPSQNGHGQSELLHVDSVKPLALAGATDLRDPRSVPAKKLVTSPAPPPPEDLEDPEIPEVPETLGLEDPIVKAAKAATKAAPKGAKKGAKK